MSESFCSNALNNIKRLYDCWFVVVWLVGNFIIIVCLAIDCSQTSNGGELHPEIWSKVELALSHCYIFFGVFCWPWRKRLNRRAWMSKQASWQADKRQNAKGKSHSISCDTIDIFNDCLYLCVEDVCPGCLRSNITIASHAHNRHALTKKRP